MDRDGFRETVLGHKDRVHSHALWMLRDREEARDVAQEAFVRLWEHRAEVVDGAARGWLLRTAHNLCIDRLRRRAARPEGPLGPAAGEGPGGPAAATADPERLAASAETGRAIRGALGALSPRDRAAVLLREVHGLSYEETARALGVPLGTLKAALHRARERLRRELAAAGVTP